MLLSDLIRETFLVSKERWKLRLMDVQGTEKKDWSCTPSSLCRTWWKWNWKEYSGWKIEKVHWYSCFKVRQCHLKHSFTAAVVGLHLACTRLVFFTILHESGVIYRILPFPAELLATDRFEQGAVIVFRHVFIVSSPASNELFQTHGHTFLKSVGHKTKRHKYRKRAYIEE